MRIVAIALALGVMSIASNLAADEPKKDDAIEMSADTVDIDAQAKTASFSGHVKLSRADLHVACPKLDVRYEDGAKPISAKATGGVVAEAKGMKAEAPEALLDLTTHTLAFSGGVKVTQGAAWLAAEKAVLNLDTGKITLTQVKGALPLPSK